MHSVLVGCRHRYGVRAWNAVREGRVLGRIQQAAEAPMPLPK
ncbi:hypothetical protein OHA04_27360 [Streptomyces sp. NBC_01590]